MTRRRVGLSVLLVVLVAVLASISIGIHYIVTVQGSARPAVDRRDVVEALPEGIDRLAQGVWQEDYYDDSGSASSLLKYARPDDRSYLNFSVTDAGEPLRAQLQFWSENPRGGLEADDPGRVRDVEAEGLHADSATVICGSIQKSSSDEYEQCGLWVYWARYGQYTLYVQSTQDAMDRTDFMQIVTTADRNMDRVLG